MVWWAVQESAYTWARRHAPRAGPIPAGAFPPSPCSVEADRQTEPEIQHVEQLADDIDADHRKPERKVNGQSRAPHHPHRRTAKGTHERINELGEDLHEAVVEAQKRHDPVNKHGQTEDAQKHLHGVNDGIHRHRFRTSAPHRRSR